MFLAKGLDEQSSGFVITDSANGKHVDAEVSEVADRVGSASGNEFALAMLENENGSFARDARNFAEDKFISDEISEDGDGDVGERFHQLAQAIVLFEMFGHLSLSNPSRRGRTTAKAAGQGTSVNLIATPDAGSSL